MPSPSLATELTPQRETSGWYVGSFYNHHIINIITCSSSSLLYFVFKSSKLNYNHTNATTSIFLETRRNPNMLQHRHHYRLLSDQELLGHLLGRGRLYQTAQTGFHKIAVSSKLSIMSTIIMRELSQANINIRPPHNARSTPRPLTAAVVLTVELSLWRYDTLPQSSPLPLYWY